LNLLQLLFEALDPLFGRRLRALGERLDRDKRRSGARQDDGISTQ
jgi:hypothetical protein